MNKQIYKIGYKFPESDDLSIMSFGKHQGSMLGDIPNGYIIWMWENTDIKNEVKEDTEKGSIARYFQSAYNAITK